MVAGILPAVSSIHRGKFPTNRDPACESWVDAEARRRTVFYQGLPDILQTLVLGVLGYAAMVAMLRLSGKRTLSKMNMFDFVVTVALGSLLASTILSESVSLSEGITAFAVLIASQFVVTWISVRSETFKRLVKAEPTLLYHDGEFLRDAMRKQRVTHEEILCAARKQSFDGLNAKHSVILETDGTLNVVRNENPDTAGSLAPVAQIEP
jgi:uncharacterized membrane protein YcaP (DUF421 family)